MKLSLSSNISFKICQNTMIFTALLVIFSAIVYFFYALTPLGISLAIILSIFSLIIINRLNILPLKDSTIAQHSDETKQTQKSKIISISIYLIFLFASLIELIANRSGRPLISPWEVVSGRFFLFYLLSTLSLILLISQNNFKKWIYTIGLGLHYLLSLSVAVIVYKVGYGFDPFIHQAAMEMINQYGVITPKTPYYLGEYGLVIILHKIFGVSIYLLNKFLVPIAATLILPNFLYTFFLNLTKNSTNQKVFPLISTLLMLSLSLPLFIVSTPQNFSYIFVIISIISGLTDKHPIRPIIFALAAAAIHPLSGIPAIIWGAWLVFKKYQKLLNNKTGKIVSAIILSCGAILLPLALFITSGGKLQNIKLNFISITKPLTEIFSLSSAGQENWLNNLIYFIFYNYKAFVVILITSGIILFYKRFKQELSSNSIHSWKGLLTINISLLAAFILSGQINFNELIAYEQAGYARRIITIITIFFMPFATLTLVWLTNKIAGEKEIFTKIIWLSFILTFITTSLYLAYPRFDKYFNSRGYSTSTLDLEAVQNINKGTNKQYIVLANQQVSAAALNLLGFNHYYKSEAGDIYFYPIPTGGRLYQYYLDMVYQKPDRATMLQAMDLVGVNEGYLIINKYWHESGKIINAAKLTANSWVAIGDKEIFIFQYNR